MRKEKKYHFIYKTTNLLSGRYYIGMHSTDNLEDGYLGSGTYLRRSLNKHGKENHVLEILEFCNSRKELKSREEEIVNLQEIAKKDCMNLKIGGQGGFSHINKYEKIKNSIKGGLKLKHRLETDPDFRKNHKNVSIKSNIKRFKSGNYKSGKEIYDWTGKPRSEETKKKISEAKKGKGIGCNNSQFGTCWITNEKVNKKINRGDEIPNGFRLGRVLR